MKIKLSKNQWEFMGKDKIQKEAQQHGNRIFSVKINLENDAFAGDPTNEISRLLEVIKSRISHGETSGKLLDINGNSVGSFEII